MAEKSEKRRIYLYINGKEVEDNLKSLTSTSRQLKNEIAKLTPGTDDFIKKSKELQQVNGRISSIKKEVSGLGGVFGSLKTAVSSNLFAMVSWGAAIGAAGSIIRGAYKTVTEYQQAIADLGALTGSSGDKLKGFSEQVLIVSKNTDKGAVEIAKAFTIVGSAQPELLKSAAALGTVTEAAVLLAKAGNMDIPEAAKSLTKSMNQFGAGANEAAKYTDILATSQQKGTATIAELSESMVKGGGSARGFKLDFEETNAILQGFAAGGTVGSEAGTQMAGVLSKLAKVSNKEFNPAHTNAIDVIDNLSKANLSYTELLEMTDAEGAKWITTLINQNSVIQGLNGNLYDHGSALAQADKRYDTLTGKTEKLSNNWDRLIVSMDDGSGVLGGTMSSMLDNLNDFFEGFTNLTEGASDSWQSFMNNYSKALIGVDFGIQTVDESITNVTSKFQELSAEQLKGSEIGKTITDTYIKLGLSGLEAATKLKELREGAIVQIQLTTEEQKALEDKAAAERKAKDEAVKAAKELSEEKTKAAKKAAEEEIKEKEKLAENIKKLKEEAVLRAMEDDEAEIERIRLKYEKLLEEDLLNEEQKKEIQFLRDEEIAIKEAEQEEKRLEKEAKKLEDENAFLDEMHLLQKQGIDKELADVDAKYEALYAKADKFGIDTNMLQKMHAEEIILINKKQYGEEQKAITETQKAKRQAINDTIEAFSSMFMSLESIFEGSETMQKGFTVGQIAVDTAKAISSLTAASEGNPGNALTLGGAGIAQFAAGMLRIAANMVKAKNLLKFNEGGFTGPGYGSADSSGYKVAGYVHENEWVAPEWMTSSPKFADTIRGLEYARQNKTGYADGGFTTSNNTPSPVFENESNTALISAVNSLNNILASGIRSNTVIDQNNILNIIDAIDEMNETKSKIN